ncbi:MAG: DUF6794 domain-containing protein [Verrucomicrobiota bacterium]
MAFTLLCLLIACPSSAEEKQTEAEYIPIDLADAVRVLHESVPFASQAKIKRGEIEASSMHHGLGRVLRNRWGLWSGSRLVDYFEERGVGGADTISSYILEAFCRDLRGREYDLLQMMRDSNRDSPSYRSAIMNGSEIAKDRCEAIFYSRLDYDQEKRIVWTALIWNPDDGKSYLIDQGVDLRIASDEDIANLRKDEAHWLFSELERELLQSLYEMSKEDRLVKIKTLEENLRWKIDGILPRAKEPDGIDKTDDSLRDPFAKSKAEGEQSYDAN